MATVWLARDTRLARAVAIKLPSRELSEDSTFGRRFEREAQTAASLSHPNLVPVYDYGSEDGRPYLVSEFIDGSNLSRIRTEGEPPSTEDLAAALLEALSHIHAAGIVHRDIKPGNILVERGGRILLTDFGVAQSTESTRLTSPGMVVGTLDYIAPEVRKGGRATPASDLFACGTVLKQQLALDDPESVAWLATELTRADPDARPANAGAALAMLEGGEVGTEERTAVQRTDPVRVVGAPAPLPPLDRSRFDDEDDFEDYDDDPEPSREMPLPPAVVGGKPERNWSFPLGVAAGLLLVIAAVTFAVASGGDDEDSGERSRGNIVADGLANEPPTNEVTQTETTPAPEETTPAPEEPADTGGTGGQAVSTGGDDPAAGNRLNQKGYGLLQAGDPASALPILEKAVAAFPEDSTDINYAYALFNYAQALRLTGDPSSAIPLLEKRLAISDFRVPDVQAELAEAQAAAGVSPKPPKAPKPPKEPKEPKPKPNAGPPYGPDGHGPPGHDDDWGDWDD